MEDKGAQAQPREKGHESASLPQGSAIATVSTPAAKSDLLLRFFESDFFDAWIAVTYLHKPLAAETHEYLCRRLYTLAEADVERYLSQLCQLCVARSDQALQTVLLELCAQSLRIAVKAYWLLLAISQDNPRNDDISILRDRCEMAGLAGHWDLPFSEGLTTPPSHQSTLVRASSSSLPSGNRFLREIRAGGDSIAPGTSDDGMPPLPTAISTAAVPSREIDIHNHPSVLGSLPRLSRWHNEARSPDVGSRPTSPDGLGDGIFSSVFMDTGVEGLIYDASKPTVTKTAVPSGVALPAGTPEASPLSAAALRITPGTVDLSPPTSPKRRETTFGATLDFVEALCTASSNLMAFPPEERLWALQKALHSINTEMDRAAAAGVAVWWPMGRSLHQRVVRLAYKESRLLSSREKAPFTLFVEVLDEAAAKAEQNAAVAAQTPDPVSLTPSVHPPSRQEMELDPAAAEAAAEGIPWVPHHHRRNSSHDTASSVAYSALLAPTAAGGSTLGSMTPVARGPATPAPGDSQPVPHGMPPSSTAASATMLHATLPPLGSARSLVSQRSEASTFATDLSLADFASESSHSPPGRTPSHHLVHHQHQPHHRRSHSVGADFLSGEHATVATTGATLSVPLLPRTQVQGGGTWIGASGIKTHGATGTTTSTATAADLRSGLSAALAGLRGDAPLVSVHLHVIDESSATASVSSGHSSARGGNGGGDASSSVSLGSSNDSLEHQPPGESPTTSTHPVGASRAAVHPEPPTIKATQIQGDSKSDDDHQERRTHACSRTGWLCKLGLCKNCGSLQKQQQQVGAETLSGPGQGLKQQPQSASLSTAMAAASDAESAFAPTPERRVKLALAVQGGLDLGLKRPGRHHRMPSHEALLQVAKQHKLPPPPSVPEALHESPSPSRLSDATTTATAQPGSARTLVSADAASVDPNAPYGERWADRKLRLRRSSPHGHRPGWDVRSVIVKSGDDCRQELLAMQLITAFHDIFQEARLPLWLRPYEVLVTSNRTALIEMVPNAPSIHTVKTSSPVGASLRDHFAAKHGPPGSLSFAHAQRNFVESLAAYSIVCYLLQIRDRHNGNILLDDAGHLIHIDFGFMLSNSPGGVNFESAPFKLTRELLEVMDSDAEGRPSEAFDYFKVLLIQGFLAVRRHADRINLLVEMMADSGCPCFKNRVTAVQGVKRRLAGGIAEPAVVEMVLGLISDSLDAWSTRQYDLYQRVLNGIL